MDHTVQKSSVTIMFVVLGLFLFMCLFTIYCIIRQDGLIFSDILTAGGRPSPAAPAASSSVLRKCGGGLDSSAIKALPLVSYDGVAKQQIIDNCPICLSEFEDKEIVKLIPRCRHMFHVECLDTWLASHVSCPLCRATQFFKMAVDENRLDVQLV